MRGATWFCLFFWAVIPIISIHTPHAGSDMCAAYSTEYNPIISIHTPHAGSDADGDVTLSGFPKFQSTLPMRGATIRIVWKLDYKLHFNPHSPCGERPLSNKYRRIRLYFNPHSPCGERLDEFLTRRTYLPFQSTLPMRGATDHLKMLGLDYNISIHTPHAGSDIVLTKI